MVSFSYDKDTRIVEVDLPDTEFNIQSLYDDIKDWEDDLENHDVYKLIDGAGKEQLDATTKVGVTLTLLGWRVKFADRPGSDWVLCDINGGNLVCVTGTDEEIKNMSGISYINPVAPATFVTVTKTSSSSATLSYISGTQVVDATGVIEGVEERLTEGNKSIEVVVATGDIAARNVQAGKPDRIIYNYKFDVDNNWDSPRRTDTLYFWYSGLGDTNPVLRKESD
jgi:hypothetical protein